jgi:putative colanic acid biosynthesis acetyltransferase WcaF
MRSLSSFRRSSRSNGRFLVFAISFLAYKILGRFLFSSNLRVITFRILGAKIGRGVKIRKNVKIHNFRNLEIGDDCWIGEEVWFINHEKIKIGSNVCISQRAIICSGGHDYRSVSLEYAHKPIEIKDGGWVCLDAKVLSGVTIGECSVVSAGEVARKSVPDYSMLVGGEIRPIDPPK